MTELCYTFSLKLCFTCISSFISLLTHFPPLYRALPRDGCSWLFCDQQWPPSAARSCKLSMRFFPLLVLAFFFGFIGPAIFVVIISLRTLLSSGCLVWLMFLFLRSAVGFILTFPVIAYAICHPLEPIVRKDTVVEFCCHQPLLCTIYEGHSIPFRAWDGHGWRDVPFFSWSFSQTFNHFLISFQVITIEPGVYIPSSFACPERYFLHLIYHVLC